MRPSLKKAAKGLLYGSGIAHIARFLCREDAMMPVLQYHSVSRRGDYRSATIAVDPELFDRQIAYLVRHYNVIPLDQAVRCLREVRPFPRCAVSITFDDGYLDNYMVALPVLERHGASATFFVTAGPVVRGDRFDVGWVRHTILSSPALDGLVETGLIERAMLSGGGAAARVVDHVTARMNRSNPGEKRKLLEDLERILGSRCGGGGEYMMKEDHLRDMVKRGMTIGSHTVSHSNLPSLPEDEALRELRESRTLLEGAIGEPVVHLVYPGGPEADNPIYNEGIKRLAEMAGYASASSSDRGAVSICADPYALARYGVNDLQGMAGFALCLEKAGVKKRLDAIASMARG